MNLLTRDDVAWLIDITSFVPIMGTVNQGLSIPFELSQYSMSQTNKDISSYKYKKLLHQPDTLAAYHDIPPY